MDSFGELIAQMEAKEEELRNKERECHESVARRQQIEQELGALVAMLEQYIDCASMICTREEAQQATERYLDRRRNKNGRGGGGGADAQVARFLDKEFMASKIERLSKKIADLESQAGGTLAEMEATLAERTRRLETDGAKCFSVLKLHKNLVTAYQKREQKLKEVDYAVERDVSNRFHGYMKRKGHIGRVRIDRNERKLTLAVQMNANGKSNGNERVKDLKQLSGGERSYTTVAFTLALGSTTEMPVRAMDEFDVFMDSVNRRFAMENLLQFAKEQPDLQFAFLTPQDMSAVEEAKKGCELRYKCPIPSDFVKIVQMKPARENATRA